MKFSVFFLILIIPVVLPSNDVSRKLTSKLTSMIKSQVKKSMETYNQNRMSETVEMIEKFTISVKKSKSKIERIWAIITDSYGPSQFSFLVDDLRDSTTHLLHEIYLILNERDALVAEGLENFKEIVNSLLLSQVGINHERFKSQRRGCYVTVLRRELESYKAIAFEFLDEFSSKSIAQFVQQTDALSSSISGRINDVASAFQKCSKVEATEKCFKSFMKVKNVDLIGSRVRSTAEKALALINQQLLTVGPEEDEIKQQIEEHKNDIEEFFAKCD